MYNTYKGILYIYIYKSMYCTYINTLVSGSFLKRPTNSHIILMTLSFSKLERTKFNQKVIYCLNKLLGLQGLIQWSNHHGWDHILFTQQISMRTIVSTLTGAIILFKVNGTEVHITEEDTVYCTYICIYNMCVFL
jgi:hypothetical protein